MKLALDASVLLTLFNQEPGAEDWMEAAFQDDLCLG
jgi:PIN domain nuclease of toxin-antitoxin system